MFVKAEEVFFPGVKGIRTDNEPALRPIRKAGRCLRRFPIVILTGTWLPAYTSCGKSMTRSSFERLALPKKPEMPMKLKSPDTIRNMRLLLVFAAAIPRKIVSAM